MRQKYFLTPLYFNLSKGYIVIIGEGQIAD